jgi:hypothetical protein
VIPFYSEGRKTGLSKGVSMKAALIEQGFNPKGIKQNQLVMWEENEREVMEKILNRNGLQRDIKKADYAHQTVEMYKETQDSKKLPKRSVKTLSPEEITVENIRKLQLEKSLLEVEKEKLSAQKLSPWKSFYYNAPEKQSYVQAKLAESDIPYRETENGFEAQEFYINEIRKLEKEYKPVKKNYRDELRDTLDKIIMQSQDYEDVLQRLEGSDYEIKQGKFISVKPKNANQFIRLKSLGADYSEQAIRNRLINKLKFENSVDNKISSSKNQDTLDIIVQKTIKHYIIVFRADVLPIRKINKKKPFSWTNDAELDRLSELNKKINAGVTLESLRNDFAVLEKNISEKENIIANLKFELNFFSELHEKAEGCFKFNNKNEKDMAYLSEHKVTAENYQRITKLITVNESEIAETEKSLSDERVNLKETSDTLSVMEKIIGETFVQNLIAEEKQRRQAEFIPNGLKHANASASELKHIEDIALKTI